MTFSKYFDKMSSMQKNTVNHPLGFFKKDNSIYESINNDDISFAASDNKSYISIPDYDPATHYIELTRSRYYETLITVRHHIKSVSDNYFYLLGAKNIDLFMMTPSISSPMGPGSDSEAIPINFGKLKTYLTDSSQFGFEPLLMNGIDKVYCYLPSMRGENPDKRHLNQFFHCEAEIKGSLDALIPIIEGYVKSLCEALTWMPSIVGGISREPQATRAALSRILAFDTFKRITLDEGIEILKKSEVPDLFTETQHGRDMTSRGELELLRILHIDTPLWVTSYDRDRVAFYQKPEPNNSDKVINADLLFPPLNGNSFGGEIVGSGQRQDSVEEMYESLKRQGIPAAPYEWYINLRRLSGYGITSGFGLGIERFIAWALCLEDIRDAIIYPRLKNVVTYP